MATYSEPPFDLLSYARRGPGRRDRLTSADIPQIARTVSRMPEVMVKVLSRGASDLNAVRKHLEYIGRKGEVDLERDGGDKGQAVKDLLDDWDLELDEYRASSDLSATDRKEALRLVHKVLFSMPAGTPPAKVLTAVQNFCREEFALKHRYAMALHTDEPHPHVHVVIKAISEQGQRLNIRKAMLRRWRADFARHLRALGVPANATQRYVRGETTVRKSDGIYRASLRGQSMHMRARTEAVARELVESGLQVEPGKVRMLQARGDIRHAWTAVSDILMRQQKPDLAQQVRHFADHLAPVMTEKEAIAAKLLKRAREPTMRNHGSLTR
jgi:Relaxase/Mobilisation nuclease domain